MPALEFLCKDIGINPHKFSKEELILLEAELFFCLCDELEQLFKIQYKNYFQLLKLKDEREEAMIGPSLLRCIIKDILSTEEYTLSGIALYTHTSEEVIYEIANGLNANPSLALARKIIELHRAVRSELYRSILKKAAIESQLLQ
ncbi:MAG: hypothetical protein EPO11_04755 [Gammaproteobacteria bacterium]|nr:MAG: hypothetical protein EPO11_04755 [Gammaproteobacteria bacterium]